MSKRRYDVTGHMQVSTVSRAVCTVAEPKGAV